MFVAAIAQFAVNILVLIWILKKKPGERFSRCPHGRGIEIHFLPSGDLQKP